MNSDGDLLTTRSLSVGRDRVTFGCVVVGRLIANASRRYPRGLHNRHRTGQKGELILVAASPAFLRLEGRHVVTGAGERRGPGVSGPGEEGSLPNPEYPPGPRGPGPVTGELWGKPGKKSFMAVYHHPITKTCINLEVGASRGAHHFAVVSLSHTSQVSRMFS